MVGAGKHYYDVCSDDNRQSLSSVIFADFKKIVV